MITFTGDYTPDQRILIEHATVLVTPDDPKTTTDPLPDNPNLTYTTGLEAGDLNQTVTRTIIVYLPDGTTKQLVQTAKFQRSALVDEVTKHVTYNPWELVTGYRDLFASVGAPEIVGQLDGYIRQPTLRLRWTIFSRWIRTQYSQSGIQLIHRMLR